MSQVYFTKSDERRTTILRWLLFGALPICLVLAITFYIHQSKNPNETVLELLEPKKAVAQDRQADSKQTSGKKTNGNAKKPAKNEDSNKEQSDDAARFTEKKYKEIKRNILSSLQEMMQLQQALESSLDDEADSRGSQHNVRLAKLIKIISSMRAEDAAMVLPKMKSKLAVQILMSISGAKASKIMGKLKPDKAALLSAKMVEMKPDINLKNVMKNWKSILDEEQKNAKSKRYNNQ